MDLLFAFILLAAIVFLDFIPFVRRKARTAEIVAYAVLGIAGFFVLFLGASGVNVPSPVKLLTKISESITK